MKEKVLKIISKQPSNLIDISNQLECSMKEVVKVLDELIDEGLNIIEEPLNTFYLSKVAYAEPTTVDSTWQGNDIIRFGIVSDTHFNSKYQQLSHLLEFYKICEREGIDKIYHAGDLDEGEEMRIGHKYECFNQGADDHTDYIEENYPCINGITTYFITGNHDHTLIKRAGYNIGRTIANRREDMIYLGPDFARIMLTPNCSMDIIHPADGAAYALSYATQKMIDSLQGGQKPNILICGHHHKAMYYEYRNIQVIEAGTFQAQTPFMRGKRISANVGGWIITIHVDKGGTIKRFIPEWIPFYVMNENDY